MNNFNGCPSPSPHFLSSRPYFSQMWTPWGIVSHTARSVGSTPGSLLPGSTSPAENAGLGLPRTVSLCLQTECPQYPEQRKQPAGKDPLGCRRRPGGGRLSQQGNRCRICQLFTLHGEVGCAFHGSLLVGRPAPIDTFILFGDSFNKQRAVSRS